ncbi:adenylyltransferase/cytidyltransferase family protein [Candidatus Pelagibacter sp.]|nr:adenylyltransferase/cytidyltransferase family protein [Candidatus Pelagibacter sp.]
MKNKKIFISGCFDILHVGHLKLLHKANSLGKKIYLGIDSDKRVKRSKGIDRPINNEKDRLNMIQNLRIVKSAKIFNSDQGLINLIKKIKPDILMLGDDWKNKKIIGKDLVKTIVFFKRINKYSSTKMINKIKKKYQSKAKNNN